MTDYDELIVRGRGHGRGDLGRAGLLVVAALARRRGTP